MVGELVLVRNRLATLESTLADEEMTNAVGNLDVVTTDLQAAAMRTRMQPIKKVFGAQRERNQTGRNFREGTGRRWGLRSG